jgi:hypothetical protein
MAQLTNVPIEKIDPNPHRDLATHPWIERKIERLKLSIGDVGLWEGVIARPHGDRYQLAFGHHRIEAARRLGLLVATIVVRDLTDEEMLKFMGRENGEDYAADFLVMLNTWDAAVTFLTPVRVANKLATEHHVLDVARFLGWTLVRSDDKRKRKATDVASPVARACAAAHALIAGGYLTRDDLSDLSVSDAMPIVERARFRAEQLEGAMQKKPLSDRQEKAVKEAFSSGVKLTIREAQEGRVAQRNLRARVDINTFDWAKPKPSEHPLFTTFAERLLASMRIAFKADLAAKYLGQVEAHLGMIEMVEDRELVVSIQRELKAVEYRAQEWGKRLSLDKAVTLVEEGRKAAESEDEP